MLDLKTSTYFNSLPAFIQESIRQSAIHFNSEEELHSFVENFEHVRL